MKKTSFAIVAALCAFAIPAFAANFPQSPPVGGISLELSGRVVPSWTTEEARIEINRRMLQQIADSDGWQGVGKARLKIHCPIGQYFRGIPTGGLDWVQLPATSGPPRNYTGSINTITCTN